MITSRLQEEAETIFNIRAVVVEMIFKLQMAVVETIGFGRAAVLVLTI